LAQRQANRDLIEVRHAEFFHLSPILAKTDY
jgi:hypothetical protein